MDGVGEWATSSIGRGRGSSIEMLKQQRFPHSVGLLYSAFTYFTGFRVNSGEYKVMGLAPYGEPKYVAAIRDHLVDIHDDGSIHLNLEYFEFVHGLTMTGDGFERLFDGPARQPETKLTQRELDLAPIDSGRDRRDHAAHGADGARADGVAEPVSGRRRRAQLRRERPHRT